MSALKGKVGALELSWATVPRGSAGSAVVEVSGQKHEVRWRRDGDGIWIELPDGVHGFDVVAEPVDEGAKTYRVSERGGAGIWTQAGFVRAGTEAVAGAGQGKKKGTRIRSQMPGKIIRVLAKPGDEVAKDQPLLVMEAMKMENEIRAPGAGRVKELKVAEGQAVETGADLMILE